MSRTFDNDTLEEIRARNDILSVVAEYVSLRKRGRNYVGLCPFHNEKTPSFNVNPEKGIFHCFGCGVGGDVFAFLMRREGLDFRTAVERLAERAGVVLRTGPPTPAQRQARASRDALETACRYYEATLESKLGTAARHYLHSRGLDDSTIARFRLGYAPDGWRLTMTALAQKGVSQEAMQRAGLVSESRGRVFDSFRNRIMFPIADGRGRVIGFGARALGDEQPKYINSREGPLFSKGRTWYGLHLAREGIRRQGQAVVVEGYMDVIAAHQCGITNVVAPLGTALTRDQARSLHAVCQELVMAFDADAAGQAATLRGLELFRELGGQVRVARLPEGRDPDDLIRSEGPDAFGRAVAEALPLVQYRYHLLKREHDLSSPDGKARAATVLAPLLAALDNAVERAAYIQEFAADLGVPPEALREEVARSGRTAISKHKKSENNHTIRHGQKITEFVRNGLSPAVLQAEKDLVKLMLEDAATISLIKTRVGKEAFASPEWKAIIEQLYCWPVNEGPVDIMRLMSLLGQNERAISLVAMVCAEESTYAAQDRERVIIDCAETLKRRRMDELGRMLAAGGSGTEDRQQLLAEYLQLLKQLKGSR